MKIRITLGKFPIRYSNDDHLAPLKKLHARLNDLFAQYSPKLLTGVVTGSSGYPTHELDVPHDDSVFDQLILQFREDINQSTPRIVGYFHAYPNAEETKRARFIEPYLYGDPIDEDANYRRLNPPQHVLCETCRFPDITLVPDPLVVSKAALKKQDVFRVSTGMLVVRPRVLKIFQDAIGNQIESGEAVIAKSKEKLTGENRLFWVRPKEMVGDRLRKRIGKRCPVCNRILSQWLSSWDDGAYQPNAALSDARVWLEHFGTATADFALLGGFLGSMENGSNGWYWPMLMSGAFVAHLKANGVKGIVASSSQAEAKILFSKKGEAVVEPQLRAFDSGSATACVPANGQAEINRNRAIVASLTHVPWDYDGKGNVYFYLTTPEVMVLDPMTGEEDSEGPYRVPNFKKPGLYRLPVKAIKAAKEKKRGVAVDSGALLFCDNAFFAELQDHYDWDNSVQTNGRLNQNYYDEITSKIGSRFGVCTTPPKKFKSEFVGDGFYSIDAKQIRAV